nr:uncharacterized protein LOC120963058 isoform X2 [Aegilops tauschii subsp. strangulata]
MQEMMISKMHDMLLPVFSLFKFHLDAPRIHSVIKSWAVASIPGFFVCMCCAAMKHCLANNVLGISSRIQHVSHPQMLPPCFSLPTLQYLVYVLHLPSVSLCQELARTVSLITHFCDTL